MRYVLASPLPLSIADASAVEGNAGTSVVDLTVTPVGAVAADDVSVSYVHQQRQRDAPARTTSRPPTAS